MGEIIKHNGKGGFQWWESQVIELINMMVLLYRQN